MESSKLEEHCRERQSMGRYAQKYLGDDWVGETVGVSDGGVEIWRVCQGDRMLAK